MKGWPICNSALHTYLQGWCSSPLEHLCAVSINAEMTWVSWHSNHNHLEVVSSGILQGQPKEDRLQLLRWMAIMSERWAKRPKLDLQAKLDANIIAANIIVQFQADTGEITGRLLQPALCPDSSITVQSPGRSQVHLPWRRHECSKAAWSG